MIYLQPASFHSSGIKVHFLGRETYDIFVRMEAHFQYIDELSFRLDVYDHVLYPRSHMIMNIV